MPLVAATPYAVVLGSGQDQPEIAFCSDTPWDWFIEAWPTGSAVEFGFRVEEWQIAGSAEVGAFALLGIQWTAERTLRIFLEKHAVLLRRQ
jgi:hypothetical protein